MSSIDERIVSMKFNGTQFLSGIKLANDQLGKLKGSLKLDGAAAGIDELGKKAGGLNFGGALAGAEGLSLKMLALGTVGVTALANIANRAIDTGITLIKSLTVDPIKSGLQEYETQLNSVQTILANTQSKGSTLEDVNGALNELNKYADLTIYNFGEMARNIGTFTAAGVDLDTSTGAIKGIANLAALSGSNSQQASTAMYQLSQALAAGKVTLMDWNSVVNAGMGGEVFQNALKETARAQGVAVDDIIEKNGSFRESLQEGWITAEIMTQTLSKFTGDLTDEQLASMGYTTEQIAEIQKLATTAQDAATKVKTLPQLIGTLQEAAQSGWAQTWQLIFGDFEEAKELFTSVNDVLGALIGESADARNKMVGDWKELGGRTALIEAVSNAFKAVMAVIKPVQDAFRTIFPPTTGQQLADISNGIRDFTQTLMPSAEAINAIQRTAQGFFAVLDIGWMIVKGLIGVLVGLFGEFDGAGIGILSVTGNLGDFLVMVRDAIKNGEGLNKFFEVMGNVLKVPVAAIKIIIGAIAALVMGIGELSATGAEGFLSRFGERFAVLGDIGSGLAKVWSAAMGFFSSFYDYIQPMLVKLSEGISDFASGMGESLADTDWSLVLDGINTGLLAGLVLIIKKFLGGGINFELSGGLVDSIKEVLGGVTETMSAMQAQLKAGTLLRIAGAIALLTVSVVALSMIDSAKLGKALGAISVMFLQMVGVLALLDAKVSPKSLATLPALAGALILLGIAMGILVISVKALSELSWEELLKGIGGVTVLLGALAGTVKLMEKGAPGMIATGIGLIALATGIRILVTSVTALSGMSWADMIQGLVGVGLLLGAVVAFSKLAANPGTMLGAALGIGVLGAAMLILSSALQEIGGMDTGALVQGLLGMAGALAIIAGAMYIMPPNMLLTATALVVVGAALTLLSGALKTLGGMTWDEIGRGLVVLAGSLVILAGAMYLMTAGLPGAAAMLVAAAAITVLAPALQLLGSMSWDEIGRGLVLLAGSLLILAGGMYLMTAALPGAAALVVVAAALTILVPVLQALGNMTWDQVGMGLGVLAAALGVLAIAGMAIVPAIPGLVGLGVAIMLLGVGVALAGVGIMALSVGLTALAVSGTVATAALVGMITALLGLVPQVFEAVGAGIVAMAGVIAEGAPAIVEAIVAILLALIDGIGTIVPQIIGLIWNLVMEMVNTLVTNIPLLVEAGLQLVTGILNGVASNLEGVIQAATNVVVSFINGISNSLPQIIQAGVNLIINFVNGLADAIRNNTERMNQAGRNLADAIIDGMVSGITNGVQIVTDAISSIAGGALDVAKSILGIASPSKEFTKIGMWTAEGMAIGVDKKADAVYDSVDTMGTTSMSRLREAFGNFADVMGSDLDLNPTIAPVLDLSQFKRNASGMNSLLDTPRLSPDFASDQVAAIDQNRSEREEESSEYDGTNGQPNVNLYYSQTNNSPKPISPIETYRNTQNQISSVKGMVNNATAYAGKKR